MESVDFPGQSPSQDSLRLGQPTLGAEHSLDSYDWPSRQRATGDDTQLPENGPILPQWSQITSFIHNSISHGVVTLSCCAARNPKSWVAFISLLSLTILPIGFFTNFRMEVEQEAILAPFKSLSRKSYNWIENESGFPETTRPFDLLIHASGDNVLSKSTMRRVFEALDWFRETPGYHDICASGGYKDFSGETTCQINSATRFWYHNATVFEQKASSDKEMIDTLSSDEYPGGRPVGDHDFILGNLERDPSSNNTLTSAQSYLIRIDVPVTNEAYDFEDAVTVRLLELRKQWEKEPGNPVRLEFFTFRSIPNEFTRAIKMDLPLYPAVFFIMCGFTCIAFFRQNRIQSRCLLGIGAVVTIAFSLLTGNGLMFLVGVPLTNLTMSLAFVVFGVGLDDTFIIMGEFRRTDPRKDPERRIAETMEVVGLSIFVTTLTTMLAFGLGSMSAVPAIRWLCFYALPTIFIGFVYQITFFVALLVLDERRVQNNRRDCLFCITVATNTDHKETGLTEAEELELDNANEASFDADTISDYGNDFETSPKNYAERFMSWYADQLMKKYIKCIVIACFIGYFGGAMYSATLLEQEFKAEEIVPKDSYVKGFLKGINRYSVQTIMVGTYFRDVDQSNETIQQQMFDYITELSEIEAIGEEPPFCWFRDFKKFEEEYGDLIASAGNLTFNQKLDFALSQPALSEIYGGDIVRDESGNITASRCWIFIKNLDMQDVQAQTHLLLEQREITYENPINEGRSVPAFFSFDIWYIIWEFYTVAINELILTTIAGIVAVSIVGFLFIPHWTAVLFVSPLITTLYIDLLGTLQFAGISINVVTYVCLVISVGLLVDFLMHILLRYYESHGRTREEKVKDTLETIGPSILFGGLSTILGVVPLAFSTNEVAKVVFAAFFAMVMLGFGHGLIFLPVVLSLVGPTNMRPRVPQRHLKEVGNKHQLQRRNEMEKPAVLAEHYSLQPSKAPCRDRVRGPGDLMSTDENSGSSFSTLDSKIDSFDDAQRNAEEGEEEKEEL